MGVALRQRLGQWCRWSLCLSVLAALLHRWRSARPALLADDVGFFGGVFWLLIWCNRRVSLPRERLEHAGF